MHNVCPGSRLFRQPKPEIYKCPYCGAEVEIWTDEIKAVCPNCKKTVFKDQGMACLQWCKSAKDCIGEGLYETYIMNRNMIIKKKLLNELVNYLGSNKKQISHAKGILEFAEKILVKENGDWHIVIPAAILHDIIKNVGEKNNKSIGDEHKQEKSLDVAKKILFKLGLKLEDIDDICDVLSCHHEPEATTTNNIKILHDAELLENLKDEIKIKDKLKIKKIIDQEFLTDTAKKTAEKMFS